MDGIRRVVTANSVWTFDLVLNQYVRLPKDECPDPHTIIPYTGEWEPFDELEELVDDRGRRILVHRPVPWGTGARRMTGDILWDSAEEN